MPDSSPERLDGFIVHVPTALRTTLINFHPPCIPEVIILVRYQKLHGASMQLHIVYVACRACRLISQSSGIVRRRAAFVCGIWWVGWAWGA